MTPYKNVTHHTKRDLTGTAKSIDPRHTAQSAQADHGRIFLLLTDFLCIKDVYDKFFQRTDFFLNFAHTKLIMSLVD